MLSDSAPSSTTRLLSTAMEGVTLSLVVLAPWPLGSFSPFFEFLLRVGLALLLILWAVRMLARTALLLAAVCGDTGTGRTRWPGAVADGPVAARPAFHDLTWHGTLRGRVAPQPRDGTAPHSLSRCHPAGNDPTARPVSAVRRGAEQRRLSVRCGAWPWRSWSMPYCWPCSRSSSVSARRTKCSGPSRTYSKVTAHSLIATTSRSGPTWLLVWVWDCCSPGVQADDRCRVRLVLAAARVAGPGIGPGAGRGQHDFQPVCAAGSSLW